MHVSDDTGRILLIETQTNVVTPEPVLRYQYSNHLGSATLELDEDGAVISYEEYYPYGSTSFQSGRSSAEVSLKRYRYTGKERDEETGLYYHGARYYIPWLARWSAVDPLQSDMPEWSSYSYGFCNPITFNDPSGNSPENDKQNTSSAEEQAKNKNVYLDKDGKVLGYDESNSENKVFFAEGKNEDGTFINPIDLGVTQTQFAGFASLVWNESGGDKDESHAIANAVINYLENGGSKQINTLDAVLLKANAYSRAVTQGKVDNYVKLKDKNARHELSAVVNALARKAAPNDNKFTDNTEGATHWDGIDLVVGVAKTGKLIENSHRNYSWSNDSKDLLEQYYDSYGVSSRTIEKKIKGKDGKISVVSDLVTNDTNPKNWTYKGKGFDVSAKKLFGMSLFQKVSYPGEGYTKGAKNIDYSKLKLF